ncbi:hypothetical protein BWI17_06335 [Betaproteobacteria bacterium GR16-43]|nr:hypothetical protein BWI17_06335 [Betaproteobacteria bacterium GR16-43]
MPGPQPAAEKKPAVADKKPTAAPKPAQPPASEGTKRLDRMAVRAKLAVSEPGDAAEKEADHAAARVMRMAAPSAGKAGAGAEKAGVAKPQASAPKEEPVKVSRQALDAGAPSASQPSVPNEFARDLGPGAPLEPQAREFFERRFARDLGAVRIHVGARADEAARQINARAFTHGRDIAFAAGQYQPHSEDGRALLAHEIVHVLQQEDGVARRVMRLGPGGAPTGAGGGGPAAPQYVVATPLQVPPIKARHSSTYELLASAKPSALKRAKAYDSSSRGTAQVANWVGGVKPILANIPQARRPPPGGKWKLPLSKLGGKKSVEADDDATFLDKIKRPDWDANGDEKTFQVDHMIEYQLGGPDEIRNLELLDQAHNGSVGSSFNSEIRKAVATDLATPHVPDAVAGLKVPKSPTFEWVRDNYEIVFTSVVTRGRNTKRGEQDSMFWSKEAINAVEHVTSLLPDPGGPKAGTAQKVALQSSTGDTVITRFTVSGTALVVSPGLSGGIAGFTISSVKLTCAGGAAGLADKKIPEGTAVGNLTGTLDLGPKIAFPENGKVCTLELTKADEDYAVRLASSPATGAAATSGSGSKLAANSIPATFKPLSPMELTDVEFGTGVRAHAWISPSHPALAGLRLPGEVRNGRAGLFYTVDATTLAKRLPVPGLTVDGASITLGYDGTDFSVAGSAVFTIRNFGEGSLDAMIDTAGHFSLEGAFRPDKRLFDQAQMRMWYRSETGFGASGTLGITNPNKIRGIRSASVTATYDHGVFSATGTVMPSIPGVQSAGLGIRYGKDESGADSLLITGDLALAPGIPGLSGGTVHVSLQQRDEAWKVSAVGDLQPNLPGLNPNIHVTYDEGLFTGELTSSFARGIFSGDVKVGLTNRAVTPEGELSASEPGRDLRLYGAGTLNARLTEHIAGGVGIKVRPRGDLLISGRIGIPGAVTLFDQYPPPDRATRDLFKMPTVSVPLFGFSAGKTVIGIALTIDGKITGHAFVGPGRLTAAEINVIDFNPAQPDSLHITGRAQFDLPAEAGVDAAITAAVAGGIGVVIIKGGLQVTAGVAVQAHVTPGVAIDYRPATGMHVHADLAASLSPKLRFGVNGVVEVLANAFVADFTLWSKTWNLAQREVGANLSLGLNVPVDYYSDGRGVVFDPNRVTFTVPELNAETLKHLFDEPAGETRRNDAPAQPPSP